MANRRKDPRGGKGKALRARVTSGKAKWKLAAVSKARTLRGEAEGNSTPAAEARRRLQPDGRKEPPPKTRRLGPKPVPEEPPRGRGAAPPKKRRPHSAETVSQIKKRNTGKDTLRAETVNRRAPKFYYVVNGVKRKRSEDIAERIGTKKRSVSSVSANDNKKRKTGDKAAEDYLQRRGCRKAKPSAGFGENKPRECSSSLLARGIASLRNAEVKKTRRSKSIFSLVRDYMGDDCLASLASAARAPAAANKAGIGGARGEPVEVGVESPRVREERPSPPPVSYSQETLFGPGEGASTTDPGPPATDDPLRPEVEPKPPTTPVGASPSSFFNGAMPSTSSADRVFGGRRSERTRQSPPSSLADSSDPSASDDSETGESGADPKTRTDAGPAPVFGRCRVRVSRIPNLFGIDRASPVLTRVPGNPRPEPPAPAPSSSSSSSSRDPEPENASGSAGLSSRSPADDPDAGEASDREVGRNALRDLEAESVSRLLQRRGGPKRRFHTSLPSK